MMKMTDSKKLLKNAGVGATINRASVIECIARSDHALSAQEILHHVRCRHTINKVTLYRILDLFVEKNIVHRNSTGDRAFRYCLGNYGTGNNHCHFYCTKCGNMECVEMSRIPVDTAVWEKRLGQQINHIEIRLDGVCNQCCTKKGLS